MNIVDVKYENKFKNTHPSSYEKDLILRNRKNKI